jgi:thiol-disulfide isomerase/thioredoxin
MIGRTVRNATACFAIALLVLAAACRRNAETAASPDGASRPTRAAVPATATGTEVGSVMPEYKASWLDGSGFDLAERKGRVVLLNVWATWCPPCRYEIPELQRLHDRYRERGFEVIGVSVDEGGLDEVRQFTVEKKMTYPVAIDPEGKLAALMQTSVLPTSVLLDRRGKVVWKHYGAVSEKDAELLKSLETALAN